jgi:hypothetical protein
MDIEKARKKYTDTGLAATLIVILVLFFVRDQDKLILVPAVLLLLVMVWPGAFKPLAPLWFGFSHFLGSVVSRIFFSLVFLIVATPVGLARRILGYDAMKLKLWKQDSGSVFTTRNHTYSPENLEKPF